MFLVCFSCKYILFICSFFPFTHFQFKLLPFFLCLLFIKLAERVWSFMPLDHAFIFYCYISFSFSLTHYCFLLPSFPINLINSALSFILETILSPFIPNFSIICVSE